MSAHMGATHLGVTVIPSCHEKHPIGACGWVSKLCGRFIRENLKQNENII